MMEKMHGRQLVFLLMLSVARGQVNMDFDSVTRFFDEAGTLASNNYPDGYMVNFLETFVINPPGFESVCLEFTDFSISTASFQADHVAVFDGCRSDTDDTLLGRFTGTTPPTGVVCSSSNLLTVVFRSNTRDVAAGFNASWTAVNETTDTSSGSPPCPSPLLTGETGMFTSPNYPGNYPNFAAATYVICVPDNCQGIQLDFTDFDVERFGGLGAADALIVYNGTVQDSILGIFDEDAPPTVVTSSGNLLTLTLGTDNSIPRRGFNVTYTALSCEGTGGSCPFDFGPGPDDGGPGRGLGRGRAGGLALGRGEKDGPGLGLGRNGGLALGRGRDRGSKRLQRGE